MTPTSHASPALKRRTLASSAKFIVALGVLIMLPSLSLRYWQGWLYWALFAGFTLGGSLYFLKTDPALVERRLAVGPTAETEKSQKLIMSAASVCVVLLFALPGIDHLFSWSHVPAWLVIAADIAVLLSYALVCYVLSVNSYAAATITTGVGQPVISTGPYAYVRHPMYSGALLMLGLTPLALGSYWSLLLVIPLIAIFAWRLLDEERVLKRDLKGYVEYCSKVRFRLVPGVW
ncbi:isoprenylcysteine carboxylmethyltransferase family protein [Pseudolabrys taiwanensis]|uniref:Isoprenylcysteine carboxylmethyltransferase family protein n=1 Tax=Pseudolabrys taiwanensis TaxID=331696 RepID=A0A346A388_9HYPH|nr:isoprenylcysteine carboxylmethyltransferase family protein [Pseudolabrys taiwanensis]AXK83635.1 isoprenylcysteine carboxylmethyltransferase family protein [Pseudolabrys taiwanensis]